MTVKNPPEGTSAVTPYLTIDGASKAIEFYKKAFGAEEMFRMNTPDGKIMHASIKIGGAPIWMCDVFPGMNASPQQLGGSSVMLYIYVPDADTAVKTAVDAGGTLAKPVETYFYGDRGGCVTDPFGHKWWIATHVEDVAPAELEKRGKVEMEKMQRKAN